MYTNLENIPNFHFPTKPLMMESKWKSHIETAPNCPRCASSNTKFCYYNNYSFSQPRYFCKGCRRYWTKGGSLRNVPVGGGCRKSRRARSAARRAHHRDYGMHNPGDGVSGNESESGTQGVNIDLGAVFAKFLNQDSSKINDDGIKMDQESSKGASSSSSELAPMYYDSENRVDEFMFGSRIGSDFIDQTGVGLDVENVDEILDQNCSSLELQTILGDDMADVAIPDWLDDGWSLCNIIQELGLFSSDDEPKIASDPHSDQWSSDDLLGYEIFSRPSNQNPQINP